MVEDNNKIIDNALSNDSIVIDKGIYFNDDDYLLNNDDDYLLNNVRSVNDRFCHPIGKNLAKNFTNGENNNAYYNALYIDFDIKPNTTYTFSFKGANENIIYRNNSLFTDATVNITCNGNRQDITLTTVAEIPSNQYVSNKGWVVFRNQNGNTIIPNFSEVQIENGSTSSSYEPYEGCLYGLELYDMISPNFITSNYYVNCGIIMFFLALIIVIVNAPFIFIRKIKGE